MPFFVFDLRQNIDTPAQGFKYIGNSALDLVTRGLEVRNPLMFQLHAPADQFTIRSLSATRKPSVSCSGRKLEIKMVLQRRSATPVVEPLSQDLIVFQARVRGNGHFATSTRADGTRVFGRALSDIRVLPGKAHYRNNWSEPKRLQDEQWLSRLS